MGQAKARGCYEDRKADAQGVQRSQEPLNMKCETCKQPLNNFELLGCTPAGARWKKICTCGAITHAIVQGRHGSMQRALAATKKDMADITDDRRRVGVSFYEKSIDTVETGIVRF